MVAIASVWLLAFVHVRGVGPGRVMMNILATLKITALLIFIAIGFSFGTGQWGNMSQVAGPVQPGNWLFAFIPGDAGVLRMERRRLRRRGDSRSRGATCRRPLAIGTLAVIAVYVLLNVLYLYVFSVSELAALKGNVLDVVAERLLGGQAGNIMGVVSIISLMASNSAMTFAGPRVYYAMARDRAFFPSAATIHPAYKTPAAAIVAQSAWTSLLILAGGAAALATYTGFSITLFAGLAVAALFVLRAKEPNAERPFKALGYPLAPAIFVIASFAILANALYIDLVKPLIAGTPIGPSAIGFIVIAMGLPIYFFYSRKR